MRMQILDIITKKKLVSADTRGNYLFLRAGRQDKTIPDISWRRC